MTTVFADTAFYVALVNPRDAVHDAAVAFSEGFLDKTLTTEYVLVEVGNWLARSGDRDVFVELVRRLRAAPNATILAGGPDLFEAGLALYSHRGDKGWSMTDCISFAVMQRHRLTEALTTDRHFEQAGFKVLLR